MSAAHKKVMGNQMAQLADINDCIGRLLNAARGRAKEAGQVTREEMVTVRRFRIIAKQYFEAAYTIKDSAPGFPSRAAFQQLLSTALKEWSGSMVELRGDTLVLKVSYEPEKTAHVQ